MTWDMKDVVPIPGGLKINGIVYNYTVEKQTEDDFTVSIQNEDARGEGYIFQQTDDWSGVPGNTINKGIPINNIPIEYFGLGEIATEGKGTVTDPTVLYSYMTDPCFIPLTDPTCPGYVQSLYDWLKENGLLTDDLDPNDPFFDELVQAALENSAEIDDEEKTETAENEEDESSEIKDLNGEVSLDKLADPNAQAQILEQLASVQKFDQYYVTEIQGGVYNESVVLSDTKLPDNARAMRNLASDSAHRSMVRLQYDN